MEVCLVREEVARGNAAESIVPFELLDEEFDAGAVVVEAPEVERLQEHIGDQDLVVISAQVEQHQLLGRLLGLRPSDDDEAVGVGPPNGLVAKLGHLDSWAGTHIAQARQLAFDRSGQAGNDDEADLLLLQPCDQRVIAKSFVAAHDDRPDSTGNLRQASGTQVTGSTGSMNIARPQLPVPNALLCPSKPIRGWSARRRRLAAWHPRRAFCRWSYTRRRREWTSKISRMGQGGGIVVG